MRSELAREKSVAATEKLNRSKSAPSSTAESSSEGGSCSAAVSTSTSLTASESWGEPSTSGQRQGKRIRVYPMDSAPPTQYQRHRDWPALNECGATSTHVTGLGAASSKTVLTS